MSAPRKIPQHIAKELQRHVKNKTSNPSRAWKGATNDGGGDVKGRPYLTLAGCVGFVAMTASLPLWFMKWIEPLNERDGVLTNAQIRRGAFNNSGSRDAGKGSY